MGEERYQHLIDGKRHPTLSLLGAAISEDKALRFSRMALQTFRTASAIPAAAVARMVNLQERLAFYVMKSWAKKLLKIARAHLELVEASGLDPRRAYLFAANHRSLMDIPTIFASLPVHAAFVANAELMKIPILSFWLKMSGAVFVAKESLQGELRAIRDMANRLSGGRSLILFPEGHIHQGEGLAPFERGGLRVAAMTDTPIVPTLLYGTQEVIEPGSFYVNPRVLVGVRFGEPIETRGLSSSRKHGLEEEVRERMLDMQSSTPYVAAALSG